MRLKGVLFIELCSTAVHIIRRMHTYIEPLRLDLWMVYYIEYRPPLPGLYCMCDLNLYCIGDRPSLSLGSTVHIAGMPPLPLSIVPCQPGWACPHQPDHPHQHHG